MLESDLAKPVMNWLHGRGFTPYGEVPWMYRAIDVVGVSEGSIECVEMKLSLTKHVLYQAHVASLCGHAWCAVATKPKSLEKASGIGVGVLRVAGDSVEVLLEPTGKYDIGANHDRKIRDACELMEPWGDAGMPTMRGIGPAQACYDRVLDYRESNPTADWQEVYDNVKNHYAHARSMQGAMRVVQDRRMKRKVAS